MNGKKIKINAKLSIIINVVLIIILIIFLGIFWAYENNKKDYEKGGKEQARLDSEPISTSSFLTGSELYNEMVEATDYDMKLVLDSEKKILSGVVDISIINNTDDYISELYLRNYASAIIAKKTIKSVSITKKELNYIELGAGNVTMDANIKIDKKDKKNKSTDIGSLIEVHLDEKMKPRESINLKVEYSVDIPKQKGRFGYTKSDKDYIYQLSYCFPVLDSYIDGKWTKHPYIENAESNFSKVANYSIEIKVPDKYTVISSGQEKKKDNIYVIKADNVRDMAIVVANNMKKLSSKVDDIGINYYFPKFKNMDKYTSFVLDSAKESLEMYINKFGKYPYDEIDVVSCYYRSGMEFPGLILVGLPDIKNMNDIDMVGVKDTTQVVAHEMAHQWFWVSIGNDQYLEPWLDEAFAEYCEDILFPRDSKIYRKAFEYDMEKTGSTDEYDIDELLVDSEEEMNMKIEQRDVGKYINEPYYKYIRYYKPDGLDKKILDKELYSSYVYTNGSYFLYELEKKMGSKTFFKMMKDYYKTYYLKEVTAADFINMIYKYNDPNAVSEIINKYISPDYFMK